MTNDPLIVTTGQNDLEIDLAAERIIGATRGNEKIAVEIKSFLGRNTLSDFYAAYGQFRYYRVALEIEEPDRKLYLAVPEDVYRSFLQGAFNTQLLEEENVPLIVYDRAQPKIELWIR
ncbi:MAG: element excision factor XisH family protein [Bacteroidota bacterium]